MITETEGIDYVVDLPVIKGVKGSKAVIGVTKASSDRKATANLVARTYSPSIIGVVMAKLDQNYGGADTHAYAVDRDFVDARTERRVSSNDERVGRETFMAETIADNVRKRTGKSDISPSDFLDRARRYIALYNTEERKTR